MRRMKTMILAACLLAATAVPQLAQAQSDGVEKATVVFDIRMDMMRGGKTMKNLGLDGDQLGQMSGGSQIDISKVDRIIGAMTLPESIDQFQQMGPGMKELPMDFFVQFKFKDAASAKESYDNMAEDSQQVEIGGKTYMQPPEDEGAPDNLIGHLYDSTTLEMGTKNYVLQSQRGKALFSDGLKSAWANVPDHSLRVAIDLDGERDLVKQALEMAKEQNPNDMVTNGYLALLNNAKNLRFSFDLDNKVLLELGATGVSSDKSAELKSGLDSLLGMAKGGGAMAASQIPDESVSKFVSELLNSLKATNNNNEVVISIPRPKSMDAAIESAKQMIPMMMMGGPGGPPSGF